jgi:hypothetical protein
MSSVARGDEMARGDVLSLSEVRTALRRVQTKISNVFKIHYPQDKPSIQGGRPDGSHNPRIDKFSLSGASGELFDGEIAIWKQLNRNNDALGGRAIVFTDPASGAGQDVCHALLDIGYDVDLCNDIDAVVSCLLASRDRYVWELAIFDLDFMLRRDDMEDCTDILMGLRQEQLEVGLVLVSSGFGRDDFGFERLAIADASLRPPVSVARLRLARVIALNNNAIWRKRFHLPRNHAG